MTLPALVNKVLLQKHLDWNIKECYRPGLSRCYDITISKTSFVYITQKCFSCRCVPNLATSFHEHPYLIMPQIFSLREITFVWKTNCFVSPGAWAKSVIDVLLDCFIFIAFVANHAAVTDGYPSVRFQVHGFIEFKLYVTATISKPHPMGINLTVLKIQRQEYF